MNDTLQLYIVDSDGKRSLALKQGLASLCRWISIVPTYAEALSLSGGLDAVMVPLMAALEWGSLPPSPTLYQTQVVRTPSFERERGRPDFAIPGVAIQPGEVLAPAEATTLILRESLLAVSRFNQHADGKIRRIGASSIGLGLDRLPVRQAILLLESAAQYIDLGHDSRKVA